MADLEDILKIALTLDVRERASLVEKLLASLDDLSEEEADRLWAEEAESRRAAYRSGQAKTISAEEVHQKARRQLR